jgi:predicted alpha-1,6-mannanase (GH76 family)
MFSAANAIAKIPVNKAGVLLKLGNVIKGLENYYDSERKPEAYQALPGFAGGSDRFYDDNEWLGIDFLEAYELTHYQEYLQKAEAIFEFITSGWSYELGGGIYWCEQKKDTKNTCSNAPASIMALKLYTITGKVDYLDWGIKLYEWTLKNLQAPDGVFWDNINLEGKVDERKYTYNSGTMMHAAALLYKITSNDKYLNHY